MRTVDGTEAERLLDDVDFYVGTEYERKQEILKDRKRRERELVGKYVVIVASRYKDGGDLFLQDCRYGRGYWTRFMSNAKGYYYESSAIVKAKNLQFNNPRVAIVQANGKLKEVYSNGKRIK